VNTNELSVDFSVVNFAARKGERRKHRYNKCDRDVNREGRPANGRPNILEEDALSSYGLIGRDRDIRTFYAENLDSILVRKGRLGTSSRKGLEMLTMSAQDIAQKAGYSLPSNLFYNGPAKGLQNYGSFNDPGMEILEAYARFAGFMRRLSVAHTPFLDRLIKRTVSERGMGSPATSLNLWKLHEMCGSPETAERRLLAVHHRANEILAPYGLRVSWDGLAYALQQSRKTGRTAMHAVRQTMITLLRREGIATYRVDPMWVGKGMGRFLQQPKAVRCFISRWLEKGEIACVSEGLDMAGTRLHRDETDGVACWMDLNTLERHVGGIEVCPARREESDEEIFFVRHTRTGEVFHATSWRRESAISDAISAWRVPREFRAKNETTLAELVTSFSLDVHTPLVYDRDSWNAGNCDPGTQAWKEQVGLAGAILIPVTALFPYVGDSRVLSVLRAVAARHSA
jgi:hypothetical protein